MVMTTTAFNGNTTKSNQKPVEASPSPSTPAVSQTATGMVPAVWEQGGKATVNVNRLIPGRSYAFRIDDVPLTLIKRRDGSVDFYYLPDPE